jgi:hypothetical protein
VGSDRFPETLLDLRDPPSRVGPEQQVVFPEIPHTRHHGVGEGEVPERNPRIGQARNGSNEPP